jgi:antibiotic biosynthesis monooxygenase (ABM) superfamily enzyme
MKRCKRKTTKVGDFMPIHVAIVRRVRPGCEAEFQNALREFLQQSFAHCGVQGASMLTPLPGSGSREFGILRTFANEHERDTFYQSAMFNRWDERARSLTEGEPEYRQLTGLEAWFRSPYNPPSRWKMALATYLGVFPVALGLNLSLGPLIQSWPFIARNAVFNLCMIVLLTWAVMPLVTRLLRRWLEPQIGRDPGE